MAAEGLLPTVPGRAHGVVSLDPPRIQCDGCGYLHEGESGKLGFAVLQADMLFNPKRYSNENQTDHRRLCRECRRTEWPEFREW